jgi:hypothetical protein
MEELNSDEIKEKLERLRILEEQRQKAIESARRSKQRPEYKEVKKRNSADYYQRHKEKIKEKRLAKLNEIKKEEIPPKP